MTARIQFRDLRTEADEKFIEAVYREVLEPSFSSDELDSLELVLDGLAEGGSYESWGLCALDRDTPAGCVLGYPYPESGVLLIGYVAARPGERSRGIGGLLLAEARRRWYGKAGLSLVLAEIDDPRCHPVVDGIDPERRVAFYARHGTQIIVGPYFQPRLDTEGRKRVYGMFLSVLYGASGCVSAPRITRFLEEYFRQSAEGSDWPRPEDIEGNVLVGWYRGRETVSLHPIGEYRDAGVPQLRDLC
jgi:GNAT superfamily N-acetyltransferase